MGWIREGSCPPERCQGRCCKHFGIWYDDTPNSREFLRTLQARGVEVYEAETAGSTKFMARIEQTCQWLTGEGLCSLHPSMNPGPDKPPRPEWCETWPTEPQQLVLDTYCGFRFKPDPSEVGST